MSEPPYTALILAGAQTDAAGRPSPWRNKVLVRVGVWSFAFYLVHWAVMTVLFHLVTRRTGVLGGVVLGVGALAMSIVVAAGAHRWVERPLERRRRGSYPRPRRPTLQPVLQEGT